MSTVTAFQPTPAHELKGYDAISNSKLDTSAKNGEAIPRGPVEANLSFYKAPEDGSKV